jgi:hypothetical protein
MSMRVVSMSMSIILLDFVLLLRTEDVDIGVSSADPALDLQKFMKKILYGNQKLPSVAAINDGCE